YVSSLSLNGYSLLEPGAGSGLISFYASQNGARVTATDINPVAIEYLQKNSKKNNVEIRVIQSDLFDSIPKEQFDIIAINPPYYRKDPETWKDHAWYCGKNGEYFSRLFNDLSYYTHKDSITLMVLCEGCDLKMIRSYAERSNFLLTLVLTKQNILEKNFIYKIEKQL
ncbi:MAG TPA: methyltransferase, partial [Chitinophagaceae bacterium]|nr:methyltransferase [Chitinophagaceae bacterium]